MIELFRRRKKTSDAAEDRLKMPDALNAWDVDILERGLTEVTKQIIKDFDGQLPEVIILPDATARPLVYALKPIFAQISKGTHRNVPLYFFFNSTRPDVVLNVQEGFLESGETIDTREELQARLREIGYSESLVAIHGGSSDPEGMKAARRAMKERAVEIKSFTKDAHIAVIDDYATESATTAREIRRAFKDPDMHAYSIFGAGADTVHSGVVIDPADTAKMNPDHAYTATLSYSGRMDSGVQKESGSKYAMPIVHENKAFHGRRMKKLRDEMTAIGERVALSFENSSQNSV